MHAVEDQQRHSPREKLLAVEREISDRVFEREEEIRGFTVGLLARAHVLFLGPKGCAKSMIARLLADAIAWAGIDEGVDPYFRTQLGRDSVLDELFGPVSTAGFEQDTFRRNTAGMLPEKKVGVLEEIYKSNSTVLNRLLTMLNEGLFKNGTDPEIEVPLQLVLGTSNELPDDRDEALDAFHDRFLLRFSVSYLKDPANVRRMMERANSLNSGGKPELSPIVHEVEIEAARREAAEVDVSPVFDAMDQILASLADREIHHSDRRRAALVGLVKAQAYLAGRETAIRDDLSILTHALWEEPEHITEVRRVVLAAANPQAAAAQDLFDAVTDSYENAMRVYRQAQEPGTDEHARHTDPGAAEDPVTTAGVNTQVHLKNAQRKLFNLREEANDAGASPDPIDALLEKTKAMHQEVERTCLSLDL